MDKRDLVRDERERATSAVDSLRRVRESCPWQSRACDRYAQYDGRQVESRRLGETAGGARWGSIRSEVRRSRREAKGDQGRDLGIKATEAMQTRGGESK